MHSHKNRSAHQTSTDKTRYFIGTACRNGWCQSGSCGQWESGLSLPSVEKLSKLAVLLEIRFEWLTAGRGEMEYIPEINDKKAGFQFRKVSRQGDK